MNRHPSTLRFAALLCAVATFALASPARADGAVQCPLRAGPGSAETRPGTARTMRQAPAAPAQPGSTCAELRAGAQGKAAKAPCAAANGANAAHAARTEDAEREHWRHQSAS